MANKRQQIIDYLDDRLRTITIANGYNSDVGNNVFAWRETQLQPNELPALIYTDKINGLREDGPVGMFRWSLQIEMIIAVESGADTPKKIREIIEDVFRLVGHNLRWNNLAQTTELPSGDEMTIEKHDKTIGQASIIFNIIYDAPKWEM